MGTPFPYSGDPATTVALNSPHGLDVVPTSATSEDIYFADTNNNVVDDVNGIAAGQGNAGNGTPEAPWALMLPSSFLVMGGAVYVVLRRKRRGDVTSA